MRPLRTVGLTAMTFLLCAAAAAQESPNRVDATTLTGKVMCGYQGWFNCDGDGAELGWTHWARRGDKPFAAGNVTVDLWPDVSELGDSERFATGFRHADGRVAEVYSSHHRDSVVRHFRWMREYGIDGAFLQRFANGLDAGKLQRHKDVVLASVRAGAEQNGRVYAAMFDEVDEGTAIFKLSDAPPVGPGVRFLGNEGLPSDYYLRLVGQAGKAIRGEITVTDQVPVE